MKLMIGNVNSLNITKIIELKLYIYSNDIDIIGKSKTWIDEKSKFYLNGNSICRSDRGARGGEIALIVKKTPSHDRVFFEFYNVESVPDMIKTNFGNIQISSIYNPSLNNISKKFLNSIRKFRNHLIVMGDFNTRHLS